LGAKIFVLGTTPNGKNINVACGSQHTEKLSKLVRSEKMSTRIAFDGDGDRVILIDEKGRTLVWGHIIAMAVTIIKGKRYSRTTTAVVTVMANLGLRRRSRKLVSALWKSPLAIATSRKKCRKTGAVLWWEQSGTSSWAPICPRETGLLTALHALSILKEEKKYHCLTRFLDEKISANTFESPRKDGYRFLSWKESPASSKKLRMIWAMMGRVLVRLFRHGTAVAYHDRSVR